MQTSRHDGWAAYVRIEADLDERLVRQGGGGVRGKAPSARRREARVRRRRLSALLLAVGFVASVALVFGLTGCGYGDEVTDAGPITSPEPTDEVNETSPDEPERTTTTESGEAQTGENGGEAIELNVYYARGDEIGTGSRIVAHTTQTAETAMQQLLDGPTEFESETADMTTAIPEGTTLLGVDVDADGTATVDLSKEFASGGGTLSMTMRLAQVVYTLTQFPTVDRVGFMLDGEPVTVFGGEGILLEEPVGRDYFEDVTPAILIENPAVGEKVTSPLRLTGTANTFEATFQVNIVNWDGLIVKEETVTATSGSGTRGTFDVTLEFDPQQPDAQALGRVIAFTLSARDGSQENIVEVPIQIIKPE